MIWFGAAISILVAMGVWSGDKPRPEGNVYLTTVEAPAHVDAGAPVDVAITGDLPTPAYELVEPDVQRNEKVVTIHLASRLKNGAMSIQVLAPFRRDVLIQDLEPGAWTVNVEAAGGAHQSVRVQVGD
jgi:hypothetical protein